MGPGRILLTATFSDPIFITIIVVIIIVVTFVTLMTSLCLFYGYISFSCFYKKPSRDVNNLRSTPHMNDIYRDMTMTSRKSTSTKSIATVSFDLTDNLDSIESGHHCNAREQSQNLKFIMDQIGANKTSTKRISKSLDSKKVLNSESNSVSDNNIMNRSHGDEPISSSPCPLTSVGPANTEMTNYLNTKPTYRSYIKSLPNPRTREQFKYSEHLNELDDSLETETDYDSSSVDRIKSYPPRSNQIKPAEDRPPSSQKRRKSYLETIEETKLNISSDRFINKDLPFAVIPSGDLKDFFKNNKLKQDNNNTISNEINFNQVCKI